MLVFPAPTKAASFSEIFAQINSIRDQLAAIIRLVNLRSGSMVAQVANPLLSPVVDLKVNGSDQPVAVKFNSNVTLSWTSQNASQCSGFGHIVPTSNGTAWTDMTNLGTSGSVAISARHQNFGYTNPLKLEIKCTNGSKSGTDAVTFPVTP